jgi:hypothetical protein
MTTRHDVFGTVHKGLRASLFATAALAGRTDFASAEEAEAARAAAARLVGFLDEHAAHEDAVLLPALEAFAPELHAELRTEHARTEGLQRDVEAIAARLGAASAAERVSRLASGTSCASLVPTRTERPDSRKAARSSEITGGPDATT